MHNICFWTEVLHQLYKRHASDGAGDETRKYLNDHEVTQRAFYPGQGRGVSRVYPWNTVCEVGIYTGTSPGTMNTLCHIY